MRRLNFVLAVVVCLLLGFGTVATAGGFGKFKKPVKKCFFTVDPGVFIGKANVCGDPYPAGNPIVAADWENGFGLPDDDGNAFPCQQDNQALLLSKNGPTPDCSSAGAEIKGVKGITLTELGFDIRNGGHCGAGAPRFNITTTTKFYFLGCNSPAPDTTTPGAGWNRLRWGDGTAGSVSAYLNGISLEPITEPVQSIEIVFDEGVDIGPDFSGFVMLDNIDINGTLLGSSHPVQVTCIPVD
jgi:hypothetical protein